MARSRETKIELTAYDDLFQTDESREAAKETRQASRSLTGLVNNAPGTNAGGIAVAKLPGFFRTALAFYNLMWYHKGTSYNVSLLPAAVMEEIVCHGYQRLCAPSGLCKSCLPV